MEKRNTKIFIMCGKARTGKDTSAAIIKEIYEEKGLKVINLQYSSYIKEYAKRIIDWDGSEETKPREFLQYLGTDVIRTEIDEEFFIKKIIDDIKVYSYFFDIITISDARFKIEIDKVKEKFDNVFSFHVTRLDFNSGLTEKQKQHKTEIDLDNYNLYDFEIENNSDIKNLNKNILNKIKEVENES